MVMNVSSSLLLNLEMVVLVMLLNCLIFIDILLFLNLFRFTGFNVLSNLVLRVLRNRDKDVINQLILFSEIFNNSILISAKLNVFLILGLVRIGVHNGILDDNLFLLDLFLRVLLLVVLVVDLGDLRGPCLNLLNLLGFLVKSNGFRFFDRSVICQRVNKSVDLLLQFALMFSDSGIYLILIQFLLTCKHNRFIFFKNLSQYFILQNDIFLGIYLLSLIN